MAKSSDRCSFHKLIEQICVRFRQEGKAGRIPANVLFGTDEPLARAVLGLDSNRVDFGDCSVEALTDRVRQLLRECRTRQILFVPPEIAALGPIYDRPLVDLPDQYRNLDDEERVGVLRQLSGGYSDRELLGVILYGNGRSLAEVARALNVSKTTAHKVLHTTLERMRAEYQWACLKGPGSIWDNLKLIRRMDSVRRYRKFLPHAFQGVWTKWLWEAVTSTGGRLR